PFVDPLVVTNVHLDHISRDAGTDWVEVDVHLSIVSGLIAAEVTPQEEAADEHYCEGPDDQPEPPPLRPSPRNQHPKAFTARFGRFDGRDLLGPVDQRVCIWCCHGHSPPFEVLLNAGFR